MQDFSTQNIINLRRAGFGIDDIAAKTGLLRSYVADILRRYQSLWLTE